MEARNIRFYGTSPIRVALIHGGPGAGGEMAPVARVLAPDAGIIEPIQTAMSIDGQLEELRAALAAHSESPVILAGFSWGAWLGFLFAARYPATVEKLVLIGSGPFEERYATEILSTRLARLNAAERREAMDLSARCSDPSGAVDSATLARFGALFEKADAYDPFPDDPRAASDITFRADIHRRVWREVADLRRTGHLLDAGTMIRCPVVAIHGDHDPHPVAGVRMPLSAVLRNFRFILLEHCGHRPWTERRAREKFFAVLRHEINSGA